MRATKINVGTHTLLSNIQLSSLFYQMAIEWIMSRPDITTQKC